MLPPPQLVGPPLQRRADAEEPGGDQGCPYPPLTRRPDSCHPPGPGRTPRRWPRSRTCSSTTPNPIERQLIFGALCHWLSVAHQAFGPGLVWVNGGFVTHKAAPPHDVDLVFIPDDLDTARKSLVGGEGYSLLTVQDMFFSIPEPGGHLVRLQPFGGLVDAFLVDPR